MNYIYIKIKLMCPLKGFSKCYSLVKYTGVLKKNDFKNNIMLLRNTTVAIVDLMMPTFSSNKVDTFSTVVSGNKIAWDRAY